MSTLPCGSHSGGLHDFVNRDYMETMVVPAEITEEEEVFHFWRSYMPTAQLGYSKSVYYIEAIPGEREKRPVSRTLPMGNRFGCLDHGYVDHVLALVRALVSSVNAASFSVTSSFLRLAKIQSGKTSV